MCTLLWSERSILFWPVKKESDLLVEIWIKYSEEYGSYIFHLGSQCEKDAPFFGETGCIFF